jgi:kynurenine formamidase
MTHSLPTYDELPPASHGGRSGWGVFGTHDQIGLANLLTPERIVDAARLVTKGAVFPLDLPVGTFDPPLNPRRLPPEHVLIRQPNLGFDDAWNSFFPQAGSQWDSLSHIGYTRESYYNGATDAAVSSGERNSIHHWAQHGIAGRAVVLDLESVLSARLSTYSAGDDIRIVVDDLESARIRAGIDYVDGDILLIYTGYTKWYVDQDASVRASLPGHVTAAGLDHSEEMCRYLWNSHVSAVASDTFAVEAWPANTDEDHQPFGFIHQMLIGSFGMALGELWWLHDLVEDCRHDGVWQGMLVSAPMIARGGISSPANAVVIK